jgi:MFS family permease
LVLAVCSAAWLFDCLNQQIFNLSRMPAMADLLVASPGDPRVAVYGGWGTSMLLVGWATGGILFGILADRAGRVKCLMVMILFYSLATGVCGLTREPWQYILCCLITGVGGGGIFSVGCTLVAESLPDSTRPQALGMLQALSALGNVGGGLLGLLMIALWSQGVIATQWRWMFALGAAPALLAILVARRLREPDAWKNAVAAGKMARGAGSLRELFGDPRWRRRAIVGLLLASSGVVGLWGIGAFSNDLTQSFIGSKYDQERRDEGQVRADMQFVAGVIASPAALDQAVGRIQPKDLLGDSDRDLDARLMYEAALDLRAKGQEVSLANVLAWLDRAEGGGTPQTAAEKSRWAARLREASAAAATPVQQHIHRILMRQKARGVMAQQWAAVTLVMFNIGAFLGMYAFARLTHRIGRRPAFAWAFLAAGITTAVAFLCMSRRSDLFWMAPLMGACELSVFGGYAIYFPELFPTRLRATGTSFCYNVGRYVAAAGPLTISLLKGYVFVNPDNPVQSFRYAGVTMCACYLVGLVALVWAPETKGQPLPE